SKVLEFTGSKRHLFFVQNGVAETLQSDRTSIGGRNNNYPVFSKKTILLEKGDTIFLCSDGFIDQNGTDGKKYGTKNFKELIVKLSNKEFPQLESVLNDEFAKFKGNEEQRDDVTLIGIKI